MASELRVDQIKYGSSGSSTPNINLNNDNSSTFNGDINVIGTIKKNGVEFSSLPPQIASGNGTTVGATLKSDGTNAFWELIIPFETAFTITRGYIAGGYQNSTAWRSVNRFVHATSTVTNLGDIITFSDAYTSGSQNLAMKAYVFGAGDFWDGTSTNVVTFSMVTDTNTGLTGALALARNRSTSMRREFRFTYIQGGGGAQLDKFNHTTETSSLSTSNPEGNINNPAAGYDENNGVMDKGQTLLFPWATESYVTSPSACAGDGSNKTLSSRKGFSYWNDGGGYATTTAMSRRTTSTMTTLSTVGKPGSTGEENFHTGMNEGYMNGMYNGAQNNQGGRINYTTHSFTFDNAINTVGTGGRASAACIEFGTVTAGYTGK
jgi:hypothetical protein